VSNEARKKKGYKGVNWGSKGMEKTLLENCPLSIRVKRGGKLNKTANSVPGLKGGKRLRHDSGSKGETFDHRRKGGEG